MALTLNSEEALSFRQPCIHVPRRIILFSLLFFLLTIAVQGAFLSKEMTLILPAVAPKLLIDQGEIKIKDRFQKDFVSAQSGQLIFSGTEIKTGDSGEATLRLDRNAIRLAPQTDLSLVYTRFLGQDSRLVLRLKQGQVWVHAHDAFMIETPRVKTLFAQTTADYIYRDSFHDLKIFEGMAVLELLDEQSEILIKTMVPLSSHAHFADSQIVPQYAQLHYSKIKKELSILPLNSNQAQDAWVQKNRYADRSLLAEATGLVQGQQRFIHNDWWNTLRHKIIFSADRKNRDLLQRFETGLLNALQANTVVETETILSELEPLKQHFANHASAISLMQSLFLSLHGLTGVSPSTVRVRDYTRQYLLEYSSYPVSISYLNDFNEALIRNDSAGAVLLLQQWLQYWQTHASANPSERLEEEAVELHSVVLAQMEQITPSMLILMDQMTKLRLEISNNDLEVLLAITRERIDISRQLMMIYRYDDAKRYLRNSYAGLALDQKGAPLAAKTLLNQQTQLILQRLDYAVTVLNGAALPIDEAEFQNYLNTEAKNQQLNALLDQFLAHPAENGSLFSDAKFPADTTLLELSQRQLSLAGIQLALADLTADAEDPNVFHLSRATVTDQKTAQVYTFSAKYDLKQDALFSLEGTNIDLKGSFARTDFVRILLSQNLAAEKKVPEPSLKDDDILSFIDEQQGEDEAAKRIEILNRDLTISKVIQTLFQHGLRVADKNQVEPLNESLLEFKITGALLSSLHLGNGTPIEFDFVFDLELKQIREIVVKGVYDKKFGSYALDVAAEQIFKIIQAN